MRQTPVIHATPTVNVQIIGLYPYSKSEYSAWHFAIHCA